MVHGNRDTSGHSHIQNYPGNDTTCSGYLQTTGMWIPGDGTSNNGVHQGVRPRERRDRGDDEDDRKPGQASTSTAQNGDNPGSNNYRGLFLNRNIDTLSASDSELPPPMSQLQMLTDLIQRPEGHKKTAESRYQALSKRLDVIADQQVKMSSYLRNGSGEPTRPAPSAPPASPKTHASNTTAGDG